MRRRPQWPRQWLHRRRAADIAGSLPLLLKLVSSVPSRQQAEHRHIVVACRCRRSPPPRSCRRPQRRAGHVLEMLAAMLTKSRAAAAEGRSLLPSALKRSTAGSTLCHATLPPPPGGLLGPPPGHAIPYQRRRCWGDMPLPLKAGVRLPSPFKRAPAPVRRCCPHRPGLPVRSCRRPAVVNHSVVDAFDADGDACRCR